jgi:release factor glutamine methyltransferase
VRIVAPPGVFSPISDSRMLAAAIARQGLGSGSRLLDVCTGSGMLAVTGALCGCEATAVDISHKAVMTARINARLNGVRVRGLRGSLYEPVDGERFDCIVSNPPYVPSTTDELPEHGLARAWEGGRDGRLLLDRILSGAPARLRPGGAILVVHSTLIGEERTHELLEEAGLQAATIERRAGKLGPLMRERVRQGVVAPVADEEVVIVRGVARATTQLTSARTG